MAAGRGSRLCQRRRRRANGSIPSRSFRRRCPDSENFAATPLFQPLFDYTGGGGHDGPAQWRDPAAKEALERIKPKPGDNPNPPKDSWRQGQLSNLAGWQELYRKSSDFPKAAESKSPAEDVLLALSKFDPQYAELRAACPRPRSRFPVRYQDGVATLLPHLQLLRSFGQISRLRAVSEISLHQPGAAFDDTLIGIRLPEAIASEPILISLLVRVALANDFIDPIWEGLVLHQWDDKQLAAFETRLAPINFAAQYEASIRGERNLFTFPTIDLIRKNPALFQKIAGGPEQSPPPAGTSLIWFAPSGWYDQNKAIIGRYHTKMFGCVDASARRFYPERAQQLEDELQRMPRGVFHPYYFFAQLLFPAVIQVQQTSAAAQSTIDLARVAIALERHRLRHGEFPASLDELDGAFKAGGFPADAITGHPPHYARSEDGQFTLYYEGWNQTDDGGKTVWKNATNQRPDFSKGDWVWPRLEKAGS